MSQPCPKCGYARRADDPGAPDECPRCGVFYEKYIQWQARQELAEQLAVERGPEPPPLPFAQRLWTALVHVPDRVDQTAFIGRCATYLLILVWGFWFIRQPYNADSLGQSFLHTPDLVFHEAGHVLFQPFGEFLTRLGGSLFQCLLPLLLAGYFLVRRLQPFSAAVCLWWAGQNFIDVAPYIADARTLALPLVGEWSDSAIEMRPYRHDWHNILGMFGGLQHDQGVARATKFIGAMLIVLSWIWAGVVLRRQYERIDGDLMQE